MKLNQLYAFGGGCGCDATHSHDGADPDELWQQVLQIWGDDDVEPEPALRHVAPRGVSEAL